MNFLRVFLALFFLIIPNFFKSSFAESIGKSIERKNSIAKGIYNSNSIQKSNYLLGPGDKLRLIMYENEVEDEGNNIYNVLNDGSVVIPLIGQVYVQYLSIKQASELIEKKLSKELLIPQISLTIEETRPIKVAVIGEVNNPGIYSTYEDDIEITNLSDAIRAAGGITPNSNLKNIVIKRRLAGLEERYKIARVNLLDLIFDGNQLQNPYLLDQDTIIIEKAENLSKNIFKTTSTTLSPRLINITVLGAVQTPGNIEVEANTSLLQAVLKAGGLNNQKANRQRIELIRVNNNGTISRLKFKYNLSEGISKEKNPPLMNRDIVKVYPSNLAKIGDGISAITSPFTGLVNAFTLIKLLD